MLDSYDNKTYFDGQCGSLYKQTPPMVNACRKPGEWQTYDIIFEAPRFADDGKVTQAGLRHGAAQRRRACRTTSSCRAARSTTSRRPTRSTRRSSRSACSTTATR